MANDFSGDANCVALWRFENGALTTDSQGSNTLTDNNTVGIDTVDYKEGAASAVFESTNNESLSISDSDLDSGFPLKSGESNKKISVCFWVQFQSIDDSAKIWGKYKSSGSKRSILMTADISSNNKAAILLGYNSGGSYETSDQFGTAFSTGVWYHIGFTFDDSTHAFRVRIWDNTAGDYLDSDLTGSFTNSISLTDADFEIGIGNADYHDGKIDEFVVFNDILTADEIDQIRAGTYGAGTTTTPTTAPPTSLPPTTLAPTTKPPTTAAPTTLAPTTLAPTTTPPTTKAPTTHPPTTAPPSTAPPTTPAPTTLAPTTKPPTTAPPSTTAAPTSLAPTTLAPTTLAPTSLAPTTAIPTTIPPTTEPPAETVCWGHDTGVVEDAVEDFTGNWTGDATILGFGDNERISILLGEEEISPIWHLGAGNARVRLNVYQAGGLVDVQYKTGNTPGNCAADIWHNYVPFVSQGWIQVRLHR